MAGYNTRLTVAGINLTMVMLFAGMFISIVPEGGSTVSGNYINFRNIYDPALVERMADYHGEYEVLIQFADTVTSRDLNNLRSVGMEVKHVFHAIPCVYAIGPYESVRALKHVPGITWVENNTRLEFFMEQSTTTINATQAWYMDIYDDNGINLGRIDGTGVTAVVLDSGIDAGHPDLDYGRKTIMNLKSDSNLVWYEEENSDTSSGHGTHCAGTVAGNGDASGGARRGVAPGARLIGLSTGEAVSIFNALGGLEWVYDHTKPGHNKYNIRVVSNSWGTSGDYYNPQDAISQITEKLTYENNVVVVFAAGNDGGDGNGYQGSDGSVKPQTNPYSNTPAAIGVAAMERDGSGVADFSSRGLKGKNETYPDVGAPGVKIWSTAARRTLISLMTKRPLSQVNPYYFAISGTSMATPHISGVVALLWQACPEMKVSNVHDDYSGNDTKWWTSDNTRVHEAELILEASAHYIEPNGDNGVPDNYSIGHWGQKCDFAQGYGLVDVRRAVGIALTLHKLRTMDRDGDGLPDWPDATVKDAIDVYDGKKVARPALRYAQTDRIYNQWEGEWTRFNNQSGRNMFVTDQSHYLYIPKEAKKMTLELHYMPVQTENRLEITSIYLAVDVNGDGQYEWQQSGPLVPQDGVRRDEIDLTSGQLADARGKVWRFDIIGRGIGSGFLNWNGISNGIGVQQYPEVTVEYEASVTLVLDMSMAQVHGFDNCSVPEKDILTDKRAIVLDVVDYHAAYGQWDFAPPSEEYNKSNASGNMPYVVIKAPVYDLTRVQKPSEVKEKAPAAEEFPWLVLVLIILILAGIAYIYRKRIIRSIGGTGNGDSNNGESE